MHATLTKPASDTDRYNAGVQLEKMSVDRLTQYPDAHQQRIALLVLRAARAELSEHLPPDVSQEQANLEFDVAHMLSDLAAIRVRDWPAPSNELAEIFVGDGVVDEGVTATLTNYDATPTELAAAYLTLADALAAIDMRSAVAETLAQVLRQHADSASPALRQVNS